MKFILLWIIASFFIGPLLGRWIKSQKGETK